MAIKESDKKVMVVLPEDMVSDLDKLVDKLSETELWRVTRSRVIQLAVENLLKEHGIR